MTDATALRIGVKVEPRLGRRWHVSLAHRLRSEGHSVVFIKGCSTPAAPALDLLMRFERIVFRLPEAHPTAHEELDGGASLDEMDLLIDLTSARFADSPSVRTLQPVFNGVAGEASAVGALLDRGAPCIDIIVAAPHQDGAHIIASGAPALQRRDIFTAGFDAVASCVMVLLIGAVRRLAEGHIDAPTDEIGVEAVHEAAKHPLSFAMATLANKIAARLTRLAVHSEHFRIGWRRLAGPGVAQSLDWGDASYRFLQDDARRYFADPFVFEQDGRTYVFCEEYPYASGKGVLSVFELLPDGAATAPRPALEESWHLSYPQVFASGGEIWMIPETCQAQRIELYRAARFPDQWTREAVLIDNIAASDATLVETEGRFWIFATVDADGLTGWDTLHLFYADALLGPWTPHPANPVLIDASAARPAGALYRQGGALWRPAQDCSLDYGGGLSLCAVERLDTEGFTQSVRARLGPPPGARAHGAHTLNYGGGFEVIDVVGARLNRSLFGGF